MKLKKTLASVTLGIWGVSMLLGNAFAAAPTQVFNLGENKMIDSEVIEATNALYKAKVTVLDVAKTNYYAGSTRWEASLLTKRFATKFKTVKKQTVNSCSFNDLSKYERGVVKEVIQSCKIGLFKGHDGKFMPGDTFTRGQAIMVFARMLSNNPTLELNESYDYLIKNGIIHVDDRASSTRPVPRSELYLMMYRMIVKISKDPEFWKANGFNIDLIRKVYESIDLDEKGGQVDPNKNNQTQTPSVTKEEENKILNLTGNDINIVASTTDEKVDKTGAVPSGASRIVVSKAILKNTSNSDINLKDVEVELLGLTSNKSIERVYLLDEDGTSLNSTSIRNSGKGSIYPRGNQGVIPAGKTVNFYIAVDTAKGDFVGQTFKFSYKFNFEKDLKIGGSATGITEEKRFVNYSVQSAVIEGYDTPATKVYVGETNKLIGSFQITAGGRDSDSRKDIFLERITLTNDGGRLEEKIKNVKFKIGDNVVSDTVKVSRNTISATFKNTSEQSEAKKDLIKDVKSGETKVSNRYEVERGNTVIVDVYADIVDGANGDQLAFYIKNNGDVQAKEHGTNLPVGVKLQSPTYFKKFEIQAGKMVIGKDSNSPIISTLPTNSAQTNILTFNVTTPSVVNLDAFKIKGQLRNNTASNVNISDVFKTVKLYKCTGKDSCSFVEEAVVPNRTVNAHATVDFELKTSVFKMDKGTTSYQLKVETDRYAPKNVDFSMSVDKNSFVDATNEQDERISTNSIVGSATSNFWSIGSQNITFSYVNNETLDYVKGKSEAYLGDIYLSASSIPNLKLNTLRLKFFSPSGDNSLNFDQLMNVRLKDGSNTIGDPRSVESNGYVTFDNLNLKVDKGQIKLKVYADITQNFYNANTNKTFKWKIESSNSSDILMTSGRGTTLPSGDIKGLPITSHEVGVVPTGKAYVYKNGNQPDGKILYNKDGKFQDVLKYKIKSKFDDVRIKDAYVVAWKGAYSKNAGTAANIQNDASDAISQVQYKGGKTMEASVINGIARFTDLDDTIKANKEQEITIALQVANINNVASDNQTVQMAVVLKIEDANGQRFETKLISLANGNVIEDGQIDFNDELLSNKQVLRKTMIEVTTPTNDLSRNILNGSDHSLYQMNIKNLGKSKAKVKQVAFPFTINNTGNPLQLSNFKLEVSNNGGRSFMNWSEIRNNVQFALKEAGTPIVASDWKAPSAINLSEAANKNYILYARFVGNYNNGYDVADGDTIALRLRANIMGADENSDVVAFEAKINSTSNDGAMSAYSTFEAGEEAKNAIVWTDNAASDGSTSLTDANWFDDYGTESRFSTHSLNYRN